jgi:hypothetical protein
MTGPVEGSACGVTEVDGESPIMIEPPRLSLTFRPVSSSKIAMWRSPPLAGVAAAFTRWWLGRLGAISDDLVKRPASKIRQLTLHSLDVFPQRVGR